MVQCTPGDVTSDWSPARLHATDHNPSSTTGQPLFIHIQKSNSRSPLLREGTVRGVHGPVSKATGRSNQDTPKYCLQPSPLLGSFPMSQGLSRSNAKDASTIQAETRCHFARDFSGRRIWRPNNTRRGQKNKALGFWNWRIIADLGAVNSFNYLNKLLIIFITSYHTGPFTDNGSHGWNTWIPGLPLEEDLCYIRYSKGGVLLVFMSFLIWCSYVINS